MNRKIKLVVAVIMLCLVSALPAFADTSPEETETNIVQEAADETGLFAEDNDQTTDAKETDNILKDNTDTDLNTDIGSEKNPIDMPETIPEPDEITEADTIQEAESAAEISDAEEDPGLSLIAVGRGELSVDDSGSVSCTPQDGYEIISITADKDAGGVKKGNEIPENGISDIEFEDDTTITAVFRKTPEDNNNGVRPPSAAAAFGGN